MTGPGQPHGRAGRDIAMNPRDAVDIEHRPQVRPGQIVADRRRMVERGAKEIFGGGATAAAPGHHMHRPAPGARQPGHSHFRRGC